MTSHLPARPTLAVLGVCAVFALAGCGGGTSPTSAPTTGSAGRTTGGGGFGGGGGGVSGAVAAITGKTLQVQGVSTQTAVTWTASTRVTAQVPTHSSAVKVGECVTAVPERTGATPQGGGTTSSASPRTTPTTIAAASVVLLPATNGTCAAGFGGRTGGTRPTTGGSNPSPTSGGANRQRAGGGFGGFGGFGKVSAVGDHSFTITSARPTANGSGSSPTPTMTTATTTVTWTSATTFQTEKASTGAAITIGQCVTAAGKADDTGAVTATTISVTSKVNGQCQLGFRGPGGVGRQGSQTSELPRA